MDQKSNISNNLHAYYECKSCYKMFTVIINEHTKMQQYSYCQTNNKPKLASSIKFKIF